MTIQQELTVAHIEAAHADIRDEATRILDFVRDLPATVTTTVAVDMLGGVTLPDGTRVTEVRVSRTTTQDGQHLADYAEGYVLPGGYRRLAVSLVRDLIGRAAL